MKKKSKKEAGEAVSSFLAKHPELLGGTAGALLGAIYTGSSPEAGWGDWVRSALLGGGLGTGAVLLPRLAAKGLQGTDEPPGSLGQSIGQGLDFMWDQSSQIGAKLLDNMLRY